MSRSCAKRNELEISSGRRRVRRRRLWVVGSNPELLKLRSNLLWTHWIRHDPLDPDPCPGSTWLTRSTQTIHLKRQTIKRLRELADMDKSRRVCDV
ncbi:hypothetical protein KFK09_026824 [Dendrobium nobile]|uniref:Uncharacterized protein n=1 Tax=Dendrobium nobile TaxID=94219 RepID=A0A8T3A9C9_DENNO|nr:hypothetical protein KFK09_026824 [Dendrobium nobile]